MMTTSQKKYRWREEAYAYGLSGVLLCVVMTAGYWLLKPSFEQVRKPPIGALNDIYSSHSRWCDRQGGLSPFDPQCQRSWRVVLVGPEGVPEDGDAPPLFKISNCDSGKTSVVAIIDRTDGDNQILAFVELSQCVEWSQCNDVWIEHDKVVVADDAFELSELQGCFAIRAESGRTFVIRDVSKEGLVKACRDPEFP